MKSRRLPLPPLCTFTAYYRANFIPITYVRRKNVENKIAHYEETVECQHPLFGRGYHSVNCHTARLEPNLRVSIVRVLLYGHDRSPTAAGNNACVVLSTYGCNHIHTFLAYVCFVDYFTMLPYFWYI